MTDRRIEVEIADEPGPGGIVTDRRGMAWQNALSDNPTHGGDGINRVSGDGADGVEITWQAVWLPCRPERRDVGRPEAMTWPVLAALEGPLTVRWEGGEAVRWR